jgi:hypothetical protein
MADILQSMVGALVLKNFIRREEEKLWRTTGSIEGEILVPRELDRPAFLFFVAKCVFLILGFIFIGVQLMTSLF